MVVEKLGNVVDDDLQVVGQLRQGFAVAEIVHKLVADALLAGPGGVCVPDVLAVHVAGGEDHHQFLDLLGERPFVPEVVDEVVGAAAHLGAVDHR